MTRNKKSIPPFKSNTSDILKIYLFQKSTILSPDFLYFRVLKKNKTMAFRKASNNILETIGNTPLVRINNLTKDVKATVYAKVETFNPGNSIKDRMALKMIEDAEKDGRLKPGGTIIEGTSGNTGMGLAMAAIIKGYKCIFTTTDKQRKSRCLACFWCRSNCLSNQCRTRRSSFLLFGIF